MLSGSTLRELETPVKSRRVDKSQHGIVANNQTWIDFSKNLTHGAPLARFARLSSGTQRSNVYACPNGYFFCQPRANFPPKILKENIGNTRCNANLRNKIETFIEICKRKQEKVRGELKTFQTDLSVTTSAHKLAPPFWPPFRHFNARTCADV